jgi:FixJ family two-component response regulator
MEAWSDESQASVVIAPLKVLVVEDDAMIGVLLAELLEDIGYAVCSVVATEDDAVADALRYNPGLMIVDEHLRQGCGSSAVERILVFGRIPCVFIGGAFDHPPGSHPCVLQKPFLHEELIRAIEYVVSRHDVDQVTASALSLLNKAENSRVR